VTQTPRLLAPLYGLIAAALCALLATACGSDSSSSASAGNGKVSLLLTDAPGQFKAAVVTITEIDLLGASGTVVLSSTKTTTNLLTLANDAASLVKDAVVPAGTYSELRFVISGGYVEVEGATPTSTTIYASSSTYEGLPAGAVAAGTLKMPSLAQSGLKIDLAADALVVGTSTKVLLIDFDVAQSFGHEAGNSGSWVMHPVIKGADFTLSGNLDVAASLGTGVTLPLVGTTQIGLGDFSAQLTNAGGSVKTLPLTAPSATSTSFGASFKYLLPGAYSVALVPPSGVSATSTPLSPDPVTIASVQDTRVDFTITAASAP
jgi:Domain of unknown function (DUF4382)